jgi:hypothetical protein
MPPSETLMGAGGTGGRTEPTMNGQIDATAELRRNGKTLHVTGPAGFDDDERGAVIHVTVTQVSEGMGDSGFTPSNKNTWSAEIEEGFVPGPAHAKATATVHNDDGSTEPYPEPGDPPWERDIMIVVAP